MSVRTALIWASLVAATAGPLFLAGASPLLAWRDPVYIFAGFSGIVGLALLLVQPLIIAGVFPEVSAKRLHIWGGIGLLIAVILHVAGLWITSPPDVLDVLLFRSPTPFALWGVVALWAAVAAALLAALRHKMGLRIWRLGHTALVIAVIVGSVVHAWLIQGTMETYSKALLCLLVLGATGLAIRRRRVWRLLR